MAIVSTNQLPRAASWRRRLLRKVVRLRGAAFAELDPEGRGDLRLIAETRDLAPLLLSDIRALTLLACVRAARRLGGPMAEAGVLAGGSARLICAAKGDAALHLFDSFDTLQEGEAEPGATAVRDYFGPYYSDLGAVRRLLAGQEHVHFHPGWFPRSCDGLDLAGLSFVHLDLDLESSTRDALAWFWPRMRKGGAILADDFNLAEVRRTVDNHCAEQGVSAIALPWGQAIMTKS